MRPDIVRQPLMAAFVTLAAFAATAMAAGTGHDPVPESGAESLSLLGGCLIRWQTAWPVAAKIFCGILIFYCGAVLGRMTLRYGLYSLHTYLAIPFFGMFSCGLFVSGAYTAEYSAAALFVFSMRNYYACFRSGTYGFGEIFRASLCLGVIPLFFTPGLVLVLVVPLAVFLFKRSARELLVAVAGYLLPLLSAGYIVWGLGGAFTEPFVSLWRSFVTPADFSVAGQPAYILVLLGITFLLFLCAALSFFLDLHATGSKPRSILLFNLILFFITASMFFLPCASASAAALAAVPAAVVMPLFFVRLDHRAAAVLYVVMLACYAARLLL